MLFDDPVPSHTCLQRSLDLLLLLQITSGNPNGCCFIYILITIKSSYTSFDEDPRN